MVVLEFVRGGVCLHDALTKHPAAKQVRAVLVVRALMPDRLFDKKYLLSC